MLHMHDVNLQDTTEFKDRLRMAGAQQIGDLASTELTAARLLGAEDSIPYAEQVYRHNEWILHKLEEHKDDNRLDTILAKLKEQHVTDQRRDKGLIFRRLKALNDSNEQYRTWFFWCVIAGTVLISLNKAKDFIRNSRNP